jgi:hypothetical protein
MFQLAIVAMVLIGAMSPKSWCACLCRVRAHRGNTTSSGFQAWSKNSTPVL